MYNSTSTIVLVAKLGKVLGQTTIAYKEGKITRGRATIIIVQAIERIQPVLLNAVKGMPEYIAQRQIKVYCDITYTIMDLMIKSYKESRGVLTPD